MPWLRHRERHFLLQGKRKTGDTYMLVTVLQRMQVMVMSFEDEQHSARVKRQRVE